MDNATNPAKLPLGTAQSLSYTPPAHLTEALPTASYNEFNDVGAVWDGVDPL